LEEDGEGPSRVTQVRRRELAECNGSPDFCDLPLSMMTFPGTHASYSQELCYLGDCADQTGRVDCTGVTQGLSILDQLNFGIRYLTFDVCLQEVGLSLCRWDDYYSREPSASSPFFDTKVGLATFLSDVMGFLQTAPGQVVVLSVATLAGVQQETTPDDDWEDLEWVRVGFPHLKSGRWEQVVEDVFGACVDPSAPGGSNETSGAEGVDGKGRSADVRCALFPTTPESVTMRDLIGTNRRLVVVHAGALPMAAGGSSLPPVLVLCTG